MYIIYMYMYVCIYIYIYIYIFGRGWKDFPELAPVESVKKMACSGPRHSIPVSVKQMTSYGFLGAPYLGAPSL